jgi:hypothetical protein
MSVHAHRLVTATRAASHQWAWLGFTLAVGFLVPYVFADLLSLDRDLYYGVWAATAVLLFATWIRGTGQSLPAMLLRRLPAALVLGIVGGVVGLLGVIRADDRMTHPDGFEFAVAVVWRGLVYGLVDGLMLAALPILIVYAALDPGRRRLAGKLGVGAAGIAASLAMTTVYHLGYPQFRDGDLAKPLGGNLAWSLPTALTANPVASPIAHGAMHVTAVYRSYDTEVFLPPSERPEDGNRLGKEER